MDPHGRIVGSIIIDPETGESPRTYATFCTMYAPGAVCSDPVIVKTEDEAYKAFLRPVPKGTHTIEWEEHRVFIGGKVYPPSEARKQFPDMELPQDGFLLYAREDPDGQTRTVLIDWHESAAWAPLDHSGKLDLTRSVYPDPPSHVNPTLAAV